MASSIDETELARLEALAGKASKMPFFPDGYDVQDDFDQIVCRCNGVNALAEDVQEANAHYIAAACNAVPALIAEVRRLREDRAAMLRDMDAVKTLVEPCNDCWTIYMFMRAMGIDKKDWFHRDVCARLKAMQNAEEENAALREKAEALEKENTHLEETARVLAEQVGKGNIGKIQRALEWADEEAKKREAAHADRE